MSLRTLDVLSTVNIHVVTCCECGVEFGMTAQLYRNRVNDKRWFYCPNGHQQHFTGRTDAQKLEAERAHATHLRDQLEATERQLVAQRGQTTKARNEVHRLKRRTTNGVCPVGDCKRSFKNVQAHVTRMHPDHVEGPTHP